MTSITGAIYRNAIKPILFRFPADDVHELFLHSGELLGRSALLKDILKRSWAYSDPALSQTLHGIKFPNPVGLSAGFDYGANLIDILPSLGFGFHTIGTLTHGAYGGNPPPMLGRLPRSRSLLVNKGFKNEGINKILPKIELRPRKIPLGVSISSTNKPYASFRDMAEEAVWGFRDADKFKNFDYFELNISCPNLINIQNIPERMDSPSGFKTLLQLLTELELTRPVFVKMPLEKTFSELSRLMDIAAEFPFIKGFIFSNLVKDRANPAFDPEEIKMAGKGNFSGKPTEKQSDDLIRTAYSNYGKQFTIIGVGGIFTAEDAYRKIKLGASLVQLITGMIYMGPQQIGIINKELAELLKKDGFKNIQEAVGAGLA